MDDLDATLARRVLDAAAARGVQRYLAMMPSSACAPTNYTYSSRSIAFYDEPVHEPKPCAGCGATSAHFDKHGLRVCTYCGSNV